MLDDNDDGDEKDSDTRNYKCKINNFLSKYVCNPLMCSLYSTNMWRSREKHDCFSRRL